jgi:hypothetical protein
VRSHLDPGYCGRCTWPRESHARYEYRGVGWLRLPITSRRADVKRAEEEAGIRIYTVYIYDIHYFEIMRLIFFGNTQDTPDSTLDIKIYCLTILSS